MKYVNVKNNMVAAVVEMDEKTKTVMLEYENGKTTNISTSTLKRWWKPIQEEDHNMEEKEAKKQEVKDALKKAVAERKANEVKKEKAEKATKAQPGKKKSGMAMEDAHKLIKEYIKKAKLEPVINEKNPKTVWIVINGKKTSGVYVGGSKCVLGLPEKMVPTGCKADRIRNCAMSHSFDIPYDNMDKLVEILTKIDTTKQEDK